MAGENQQSWSECVPGSVLVAPPFHRGFHHSGMGVKPERVAMGKSWEGGVETLKWVVVVFTGLK